MIDAIYKKPKRPRHRCGMCGGPARASGNYHYCPACKWSDKHTIDGTKSPNFKQKGVIKRGRVRG